jgi:ribokinase
LEIPLETNRLCLEIAREKGATTILDPAPAQHLPTSILGLVDYLTPNQTEAALLLGSDLSIETLDDAALAGRRLLAQGPANIIMKMGALGVCWIRADDALLIRGFPVNAVDSTAAGDTFNGAFAVSLSEGHSVEEAARFGNAAGAISVTRAGAQSSIPSRVEVDRFLAKPPAKIAGTDK